MILTFAQPGRLQDSEGGGVGSDKLHQWGHRGAGGPPGAERRPGGHHQPAAGEGPQSHPGHPGRHQ